MRKVHDRERIAVVAIDIIEIYPPVAEEAFLSEIEFRLEADVRTEHGRHLDVGIDRLGITRSLGSPADRYVEGALSKIVDFVRSVGTVDLVDYEIELL